MIINLQEFIQMTGKAVLMIEIIFIPVGIKIPLKSSIILNNVAAPIIFAFMINNTITNKIRGVFFSNSARILPVISPNKEILYWKSDIFDNFSSSKKGDKTGKPYLLIFSKRGNFLPKAFSLDIP